MVNAIKYANELPNLESKIQGVRDEVRELEDKKMAAELIYLTYKIKLPIQEKC
jgi:hypothetical protein